MADDNLRTKLREGLVTFRAHCQSIESAMTGGGIPDLNVCSDGVEVWVECKKTDGWTAGDVKVGQVGWHLARHRAGGRTLFATRRRAAAGPRRGAAVDELWLHSGLYGHELREGGLRAAPALLVTEGGPARWDWPSVYDVIFRRSLAR